MVSGRTRATFILAAALTVGAAWLRLQGIDGPLGYDEIRTLDLCSSAGWGEIFSDLSPPGNHPLNSVAVKLAAPLNSAAGIRLGAWIAGALAVPAAGMLAWRIFRTRSAALFTMMFLAGSAPAAACSKYAGGYSLQMLLLLCFAVAASMLTEQGGSGHARSDAFPAIALTASGIAAELTMPTSAVYLLIILLVAAAAARGRVRRGTEAFSAPARTALAAFGMLSLAWFALYFRQFLRMRGSGWDAPVGCELWFRMLDLYDELGLCVPAGLLAAAVFCPKAWMPVAVILLAPLSATITHAGSARAYLPLCASGALAAGAAAARCLRPGRRLRNAAVATAAAALTAAAYFAAEPRWEERDWRRTFAAVRRLPGDMLVVFPARDGLPLNRNNRPDAEHEFNLRMSRPDLNALFMVGGELGRLDGVSSGGTGTGLRVPRAGRPCVMEGLPGMLYGLKRLESPPPAGTLVVAVFGSMTESERADLMTPLMKRGWLELNPWLAGGGASRSTLLATLTAPSDRFDWKKFLLSAGDAARCYALAGEPESRRNHGGGDASSSENEIHESDM